VSEPRPGPGRRPRVGVAGWVLAAIGLVLAGVGVAAAASGTNRVVAQLGDVTVSATYLHPGPSGMLIADVQVSSSGQTSDELDAAIADGSTAVGLYHQLVSFGEIPELTSCGGAPAPAGVVGRWLHYGPLFVPGRSVGSASTAYATMTVQPVTRTAAQTLAITLYFAHAGAVTMELPVDRS
jgi:hypothetical protein